MCYELLNGAGQSVAKVLSCTTAVAMCTAVTARCTAMAAVATMWRCLLPTRRQHSRAASLDQVTLYALALDEAEALSALSNDMQKAMELFYVRIINLIA